MLRRSHTTFANLVRAWIESTPGEPTGRARQQRAKQLLDLIWDEDMLPLFERTDTFQERVTDSTIKVVRSELKELQKKVLVFGKYDISTNVEDINFVEVHREIEEHGPNLSRLIDEAAICQRSNQPRQEQPGRIVTITAMLGLGRARQSANFLTRALGVYLHSSGVRRRVINTLHGLGIVDCYLTIQQTTKRIAQCVTLEMLDPNPQPDGPRRLTLLLSELEISNLKGLRDGTYDCKQSRAKLGHVCIIRCGYLQAFEYCCCPR
jgi:hypothetical protein